MIWLAGLTLAAVAIPEQIATARLGGFAPQIGFLAFIAGSWALPSSAPAGYVSAGADSVVTPIFAERSRDPGRPAGSPAYAAGLAALLALLVGAILVAGGLFRLRWIANLPATVPVTTGFLASIAVPHRGVPIARLAGPSRLAADDLLRPSCAAIAAASCRRTNLYALAPGFWRVSRSPFAAGKISPRIPGALAGMVLASLQRSLSFILS